MKTKNLCCFMFFVLTCASTAQAAQYVVLAWNDLGMHCYNRDFQDLAVLPPYNTLMAQVFKVGDPPTHVIEGITVTYSFPDNSYSVDKSNFWDFAKQLFGVELEPDVGLTGKGLSGVMDWKNDHFVAEGIPLTEFRDSAPNVSYPYQLAEIVVRDSASDEILATQTVVAPASSEMRCDKCHYDGGVEDIDTGRVETNILTLHDEEHGDEYPAGHTGLLMDRRPILCAECHSSNALNAPGVPGVPSLSNAIHDKHSDEIPQNTDGCYLCHPGPETQCLRDVMNRKGMGCNACHGDMEKVAENPSPWLNEPRCDSTNCHGDNYAQNNELYRLSTGHGGIYCSGCHDSPHAIGPSREDNDNIKFIALQGRPGTLTNCKACHLSSPGAPGPHGSFGSGFSLPQTIIHNLLSD